MKKSLIILGVIIILISTGIVGYFYGKNTCEKCEDQKECEENKTSVIEEEKKDNLDKNKDDEYTEKKYLNNENCNFNETKECYIYEDENFKVLLKNSNHNSDELNEYIMYINGNKVQKKYSDATYPYIIKIIDYKYIIINSELTYLVYDLEGNNIVDFNDGLVVYNVKYENNILYVNSQIQQEGFNYYDLKSLCQIKENVNTEYYEINRTLRYNKETGKFDDPLIKSSKNFNDLAKEEYNATCD